LEDRSPGTSLTLRKPRKVPRPLANWWGFREVTSGCCGRRGASPWSSDNATANAPGVVDRLGAERTTKPAVVVIGSSKHAEDDNSTNSLHGDFIVQAMRCSRGGAESAVSVPEDPSVVGEGTDWNRLCACGRARVRHVQGFDRLLRQRRPS
jgi:hypothetical protein